jgi:predicted RNA-binding Zn-ribbon protein involved in translation (DUF1610 family)
MNNQQDEQQPIAPTAEFMEAQTAPDFECPKCGKAFTSAQALRMHRVRVHTLAGRRAHRGVKLSRAQHLEKRRQYQLKLRERYYREGKDSRGRPMPPGWKPRPRRRIDIGIRFPSDDPEIRKRKYRQKVKEYRAQGLNSRGEPLKNSKSVKMSIGMKASWARRKAERNELGKPPTTTSAVQFCPRCGCNIRAVTAAIEFGDRQ